MASVKTVTQVEKSPPPKESSPRRAALVSLFAWVAWQHPGAPPQLEPMAGGGTGRSWGGACKASNQVLLLKPVGYQLHSGNPTESKDYGLSEDE